MSDIKSRNIFGFHAWNRKGAGKHKDKKWHSKNRKRGKVTNDE
jgi:hypothetical protein